MLGNFGNVNSFIHNSIFLKSLPVYLYIFYLHSYILIQNCMSLSVTWKKTTNTYFLLIWSLFSVNALNNHSAKYVRLTDDIARLFLSKKGKQLLLF